MKHSLSLYLLLVTNLIGFKMKAATLSLLTLLLVVVVLPNCQTEKVKKTCSLGCFRRFDTDCRYNCITSFKLEEARKREICNKMCLYGLIDCYRTDCGLRYPRRVLDSIPYIFESEQDYGMGHSI